MIKLYNRTLSELRDLNLSTQNMDVASVTFAAILLVEGQNERIKELEDTIEEFAYCECMGEVEKLARSKGVFLTDD